MSSFSDQKIPERFKQSPCYAAFLQAAQDYSQLPWHNAADPAIATKLAGIGAFFAYEFGQNAATSLSLLLDQYKKCPPVNAESLQYLMQLCSEELAEGLEKSDAPQAHYWTAVQAAHDAGCDVAPVLALAGKRLMEGDALIAERVQSTARHEAALPPSWAKFLNISHKYQFSKDASLGVLGLSRELLLDNVFAEISTHLPDEPRFAEYKRFLDCHVRIDGENAGHGDKMVRVMQEEIGNTDLALKAATEFLQNRKMLYERILEPEKFKNEPQLSDKPMNLMSAHRRG